MTGLLLDDLLELGGDGLQIFNCQVRIAGDAPLMAVCFQHFLEFFFRDVEHNGAKHLHQAAVGVVDELLIAGQGNHTSDGGVVEADVEHGIHHTGHGEFGARAA